MRFHVSKLFLRIMWWLVYLWFDLNHTIVTGNAKINLSWFNFLFNFPTTIANLSSIMQDSCNLENNECFNPIFLILYATTRALIFWISFQSFIEFWNYWLVAYRDCMMIFFDDIFLEREMRETTTISKMFQIIS